MKGKRLFPAAKGKRIILGEGYPYLESFATGPNSAARIDGLGLSLSSKEPVIYQIHLPKLRKRDAYRVVLEKLPKGWKSPLI